MEMDICVFVLSCVAITVFLESSCSSWLLLCDYVGKVSWFVRSFVRIFSFFASHKVFLLIIIIIITTMQWS